MKTALGKATSTTNAMPASFHPSVCEEGLAVLRGQPVDDRAEEAEHADFDQRDGGVEHRRYRDVGPRAPGIVQAEGDQRCGGSTGSSGGNGFSLFSNQRNMSLQLGFL